MIEGPKAKLMKSAINLIALTKEKTKFNCQLCFYVNNVKPKIRLNTQVTTAQITMLNFNIRHSIRIMVHGLVATKT